MFFSHINYFIPTFDIFGLGYNFGFGKSFGFFSMSRSKFFMFDSPVLLSLPKICVNISFISNTNYFVGLSLYTRLLFSIFSRESNSTITNVRSSVSLFACLSLCKTPQQLENIILHHSSFIILHLFFIHPSFISRLLSFSACFFYK